jgi:hypothetical protein
MEKKNEQSSGPGYVISDGVSTPSRCRDLEERYGLIPIGTPIAVWEKWQLAEGRMTHSEAGTSCDL